MTSMARVLLGLVVFSTSFLSGSFRRVEAQIIPEVASPEQQASPANAYGIRYATRKLVMPKGMMRGTFDVVIGDVTDETTATINLGVAISPVKHLEVGFSRYRMGSYPNPDVLRAFGGNGLVPIVAQGRELVPVGSTNGRAFGDMFAYARAEAPTTSILDIAFDFGFLIPTASEFGVLFGVPIRFHVGEVFAFDVGLLINVDNIDRERNPVTSVSLPWNLVFSVTDMLFLKLDSGFNALDVVGGRASKTFPFGFGAGVTVTGDRFMSDIFAAFSWPVFGSVDPRENTTDIWTVTIGANFYSPVLF